MDPDKFNPPLEPVPDQQPDNDTVQEETSGNDTIEESTSEQISSRNESVQVTGWDSLSQRSFYTDSIPLLASPKDSPPQLSPFNATVKKPDTLEQPPAPNEDSFLDVGAGDDYLLEALDEGETTQEFPNASEENNPPIEEEPTQSQIPPIHRRGSGVSLSSLKGKHNSLSSLRHGRHLDSRHARVSSATSLIDKEGGNWIHPKQKNARLFYEEKTKIQDPYYNVDVATDCETYFVGQKARIIFRETQHFAYIVDLDNYEYHKVVFHSFLNDILQSPFFRHGILFLVLVNAVLIGLASIPNFQRFYYVFEVLDMIILSVFIFEIIIKWIYDFRLFWATSWNILDFSIISLTIFSAVVPLGGHKDKAGIIVKVVRAFRSLRCVSSMTSLSIVSHTVIKSGLDMGNILLVLLIIMLVLSVMAVILFDIQGLTPQRFLNALDAWIVLFICVTQDGWAGLLNSYERQSKYFAIIALYLICAVSLGAFVFANLIVAVIVANLELSVKELREEMKLRDNPLDFSGTYDGLADVDIIPVYDLLAKNNFVCISQRPLRIPRVKRASVRKMQVYTSLVVALEQNMLEAEIICLDLEKIMAVLLSIMVQLDVNTGKIAQKERETALKSLANLIQHRSRAQIKSKMKVAAAKADLIGKLTKKPTPEALRLESLPAQQQQQTHHVQFSGKDKETFI